MIINTELFLATAGGSMVGDLNMTDNLLTRPQLKDFTIGVKDKGQVSGAVDIDLDEGNFQALYLTGNVTLTFSNPAASGNTQIFYLEITNFGHSGTLPASVDWAGGSAPSLATTGTSTIVFYTRDGGTRWHAAL